MFEELLPGCLRSVCLRSYCRITYGACVCGVTAGLLTERVFEELLPDYLRSVCLRSYCRVTERVWASCKASGLLLCLVLIRLGMCQQISLSVQYQIL